jgi:hypothetical protein
LRAVKQRAIWLGISGIALGACAEKGDPFLTFGELCARRAEDVCAARTAPCCEVESTDDCVEQETRACETLRKHIAKVESTLRYDSQVAARVAAEQRQALDQCEPPFPLTRFFEGTRDEGSACERDTQCTSGVCGADSQACESAEGPELCPSTEDAPACEMADDATECPAE